MFAVILLPNFRLQAALRFREQGGATFLSPCGASRPASASSTEGDRNVVPPCALLDDHDPKAGLLEVNAAAARAGVAAGQTAAQALARCPTLTLLPRSLAQEHSSQAALLEIGATLSPEIEATADGWCTVDLRTSRDRDWTALAACVVERLAPLRLAAQAGIGPNPDLAFLAARNARPVLVVQSPTAFLANLAIHDLDPSPELLSVLRDWGIHNLAQLTSLPRGELMDRLGPAANRLWERAAGQASRPLRLARPAEEFVEALEFEHEIETAEPLLFVLRRMLDSLALRLGNAYRVAERMTLTLMLTGGGEYQRTFTVPAPTADLAVLFRMIETHLDGLQLPRALAGAALRIEPTVAERQQFQLFESPLRDPNRFGETLGRLAALAGAENVGVAELLDTHQPGAMRLREPRFHKMQNHLLEKSRSFSAGLPLRRWRPPVTAKVRVVRQRPIFIESEKIRGAIREALGPYRASGGWWESDRWSAEEWDIALEDGSLYRLARTAENDWRIEGSYDEQRFNAAPGRAANVVPFTGDKR
jgi:protein ImuB